MKRIIISVLILFTLSSCEMAARQPVTTVAPVCAENRLDAAFDFHTQAKEYFQSYYKTRKENELFFAWYASEDSIYMANSVRRCYDKKNKHYHAVANLLQKNRTLQRLIAQNMRTDSQSRISELYLEEYREIFVRDIQ